MVFLSLTAPYASAQSLRIVAETPAHTDYELVNDSLAVGHWLEVMVPHGGPQSWVVLGQDIRPVRDTRIFPDGLMTDELGASVVDVRNPGVYRNQRVASLRIHTARPTTTPDVYLVTRRLQLRVFKQPVWEVDPGMRRALSSIAQATPASPLASGNWYRIPITRTGIHVLDRAYLQALGLNLSTLNRAHLQLWGTNGHLMPRLNSVARSAFTQIPIRMDGDNVIFFANGPNRVTFNPATRLHSHQVNPYTTVRYVFLTVGNAPGLRLTPQQASGASADVTTFTDFRWKEEELRKPDNRIKSGNQWLGQLFTPETFARNQVVFRDTLAGFVTGSTLRLEFQFAARSTANSRFDLFQGSTAIGNVFISLIFQINDASSNSANLGTLVREIPNANLPNDILEVTALFNNTSSAALGWLDWVRVSGDRELRARNGVLAFHSPTNGTGQTVRYLLNGFNTTPMVVDGTDPQTPVWLEATAQDGGHAVVHTNQAGRFLYAQTTYFRPGAGTSVPNQNLRGVVDDPDYIIVTTPDLLDAATRLANRRAGQGWRPLVATQTQVFNEFNGGNPDATAIRDLVRHFYQRNLGNPDRMPKALLLFGDATYDYKGIQPNEPLKNLVFTFQSDDSYSRINTFASDDYYGFLDPTEGEWAPSTSFERIDIGIGRIPVQTAAEARTFLRKVEAYENPANFGDWRSIVTFTSDDHINGGRQENDLHVYNADGTAERIPVDATGIRINKIYQISYPISNNTLGRSAVEANRAFINAINNGTLLINYSGHGSETLLSAEGLYRADDVSRLTNLDRLTIMTTVTCEFGRYDDTEIQSGAEMMLLHANGGAIAAFTTSRVVVTSYDPNFFNFGLNIQLTLAMLTPDALGQPKTFGEIYRQTKNTTVGASFNSRKFILLGDPGMPIGLPESRMRLTSINSQPLNAPLTLRALDQVELQGEVVGDQGSVRGDFNGQATVRVYDATRYVAITQLSRCNAIRNCAYAIQNDLIFSGRATVTNGRFSTRFIIPRDIAYSDSTGRIVLYGFNENGDASGSFSDIRFNGRNEAAVDDQQGPTLRAYLNDTDFMDGGLVNGDPVLYVDLEDQSGINTAGSSVGHELLALLQRTDAASAEQTYMMNEYYESAVNDFTRGSVRFPFQDLAPGQYDLTVRAWDVFNNPGETRIRFTVIEGGELAVRNLYNYPNPTSGYTRFMFEHNQAGSGLDVLIRIFTLSGRPVAQLRERNLVPSGSLASIEWNGRDADGNRLATGTYLYHVRIRAGGSTHEAVEKLVIIR